MKDWQTDGRTGGIYFHVSASNCCGSFSFLYFFPWLGGMCVFLLFSLCFFALKMLLYNATLYGHMCVRACCCTATIFAFFGSIFCCAFPWTVFWIFFLLLRCLYEFLTVICECAWFWHLCIAGSCIFGHRDRDWGFCCLNDPAQFVFIFLLRPYTHTPTWPHTDTRTHTAAAIMAVMGI